MLEVVGVDRMVWFCGSQPEVQAYLPAGKQCGYVPHNVILESQGLPVMQAPATVSPPAALPTPSPEHVPPSLLEQVVSGLQNFVENPWAQRALISIALATTAYLLYARYSERNINKSK